MKRKTAKPSTTPVRATPLKNLEPKKPPKGGLESRAGVGILKSSDGGRTW